MSEHRLASSRTRFGKHACALAVVAFTLVLVTPTDALAWTIVRRSMTSGSGSSSSSSSGLGDDIKVALVLAAIPVAIMTGGIMVDVDLLEGKFGTSKFVNYGFTLTNLMLGIGVMGYGIAQRDPVWIVLGAMPMLIGLIGLIATPIREAQRRDREDPGDVTAPLGSGLGSGFGWTFPLGA